LSRGYTHVSEECGAISEILSRIGDKWTVLVVSMLGNGPMRFNALRREIGGVSQRMLTLTLRGLERDGLVTRTVYPTVPPRVDYELTELGKTLLEPIVGVAAWARANRTKIAEARVVYDKSANREARPGVVARTPAA
jgi:DNA-binding HxlR family transcriptional regulator